MPRASCTRRPGDTAVRGRGRGTSTPRACRSTSPPSRARRRGGPGRRGGRPGRGWRRRSRCRGRTAAARARRPPFPTPPGARRADRSSSSCGSPRRACVERKLSRRVRRRGAALRPARELRALSSRGVQRQGRSRRQRWLMPTPQRPPLPPPPPPPPPPPTPTPTPTPGWRRAQRLRWCTTLRTTSSSTAALLPTGCA